MTNGIILAAGRGSRMKSSTANQPKCFSELNGRRLVDIQIKSLSAVAQKLAIATGYLHEMTSNLAEYSFHNKIWDKTNMFYSLLCCDEWLKMDNCIISYSDIIYDKRIVRELADTEDDIAIVYDPNWRDMWAKRFDDPLSDAETFKIKNGYVAEIGAKAEFVKEIEGQYIGLFKISPTGWKTIIHNTQNLSCKEIYDLDITSLLSILIKKGVPIKPLPINYPWFEFDSEHDIEVFIKHFNFNLS